MLFIECRALLHVVCCCSLCVRVVFPVCVARWYVLLLCSCVRCCCLLLVMYSCLLFDYWCSVLLRCCCMVRVDDVRQCLLLVVGVLRVDCCSCCGVLLLSLDGVRC